MSIADASARVHAEDELQMLHRHGALASKVTGLNIRNRKLTVAHGRQDPRSILNQGYTYHHRNTSSSTSSSNIDPWTQLHKFYGSLQLWNVAQERPKTASCILTEVMSSDAYSRSSLIQH